MKKFLIVASLVLACVSAKAQSAEGTFSLRPMIGMNIGMMTNADNSDPRIGLVVGTELEYQAASRIGVSAGVLYSMQGCKYDKIKCKFDYINVPILANIYLTKGLAVKAGIQPGFRVNSSINTSELDLNAKDYSKNVVLAIPIGLSYEFSNIQIDARFNWGVTSSTKEISDYIGSSNCNTVMITLGYKFEL